MRIQNNFGLLLLTTLLVLFLALVLFSTPPKAVSDTLTVTGQTGTSNGIVLRFQVPPEVSHAETPVLNVEGFAYASIHLLSATPIVSATGSAIKNGATTNTNFVVYGSAIPTSDSDDFHLYKAPLPVNIGSATTTATIQHYGLYSFDLAAVNRLVVAADNNSASQEIVISLTRERK
jgi:hypothetical protein